MKCNFFKFFNIFLFSVLVSTISFNAYSYYVNYMYSKDSMINMESEINDDGNLISILIQDSSGDYLPSDSNTFPTDKVYNSSKSYCVNKSTMTYNSDTNQVSIDTTGSDECFAYFDNKPPENIEDLTIPNICDGDTGFYPGTFQATIIENGGGVNCEEPNFATVADTNEGIFQTVDVYGPTYYFRGAVEDNWVKFAGFYWRIIRINGDGSVKLIYSGKNAPTESEKVVKTGSDTQLASTVAFNTTYTAPYYVGYTYTAGSLNNPSVKGSGDSTIKGAVDTWYKTNIENQGLSSYIVDTAYCGDRTSYSDTAGTSVNSSYTTSRQYFPYYVDLRTNKTPTLLCNDKKDYYTNEDTEIGNGALKYPVSLITVNEVAYAGGLYATGNTNYYLYTSSDYWTLSPHYFTSIAADVGRVNDSGSLNGNAVNYTYGGRPAVSLKSVILTGGNGSWATPYEVETN